MEPKETYWEKLFKGFEFEPRLRSADVLTIKDFTDFCRIGGLSADYCKNETDVIKKYSQTLGDTGPYSNNPCGEIPLGVRTECQLFEEVAEPAIVLLINKKSLKRKYKYKYKL